MERYIEEYANACKKKIEENDLMEPAVKNKITARINAAVKLRYKQLITEDEAMKLILESKDCSNLEKLPVSLPNHLDIMYLQLLGK